MNVAQAVESASLSPRTTVEQVLNAEVARLKKVLGESEAKVKSVIDASAEKAKTLAASFDVAGASREELLAIIVEAKKDIERLKEMIAPESEAPAAESSTPEEPVSAPTDVAPTQADVTCGASSDQQTPAIAATAPASVDNAAPEGNAPDLTPAPTSSAAPSPDLSTAAFEAAEPAPEDAPAPQA